MKVSRTISLDLEDLNHIQMKINEGRISNLSEFIQYAVKKELGDDKNGHSQ